MSSCIGSGTFVRTCVTGPPSVSSKSLHHARAVRPGCCKVLSGNELVVRLAAGELKLSEQVGHGVNDPLSTAATASSTKDVVDARLANDLGIRQARLERGDELGICGGECRCRRRRHASVAQQQAEGVGLHEDVRPLELDRPRKERQLVAMLMRAPQPPHHVACLQDPWRFAAPFIARSSHRP